MSDQSLTQLPEPTLRRLPWYLAFLTTLRHSDVEYVSSTRIAAEVGVDSSQIAKDLSFLNIRGKTRSRDVTIVIVAVPVEYAQEVADQIMDAGINAIWNFTPRRISVRKGVVSQNTSLYSHLAVMYNRLSNAEGQNGEDAR